MASSDEPILTVTDLCVEFDVDGAWTPAVNNVSFEVKPGEVVALVGESGSGKSVTSMSVLGLLPPNSRRSGRIMLADQDLVGMTQKQLRAVRGKRVAMIFQEPMTALNPVMTIGQQIVEALRCHDASIGKDRARQRAVDLLTTVGVPEPERRVDSYPHQLSGGQRQRAMIAMAISGDPELIIADEPTTALDVTVQAEILDLLRHLQKDLAAAVLLITHDMGVVADIADRVMVMRSGQIVERAAVGALFTAPENDYTKKLLAAVPRPDAAAEPIGLTVTDDVPALRITDVDVVYKGRLGRPAFKALDQVSLEVPRGQVLGLVGESGSGKSTIGRAITSLVPVAAGSIEVSGTRIDDLKGSALRAVRRHYAVVFQDPGASLNPRESIGEAIAAPMVINKFGDRSAIRARVGELLDRVELPRAWALRFPHELSGGQRQRVGIARALTLAPDLLIADEPTSALDVSVQAKVLELFTQLQDELGFACLFISHDLAVVELLADHVAVLRDGQLVESGVTSDVLRSPRSEYTKRLIAAAPVPDPVAQAKRRRAWRSMVA